MAEQVYLTNLNCNDLSVTGTLSGNKRRVVDVTTATTVLTEADSGSIFVVNVADNAATTLTLPEITASNLGCTYEFFIGTENGGGIDILTATTSDTTGDCFAGAVNVNTTGNQTAGGYIIAGADDNQINMTGAQVNGGGEVGSFVRCTAVKYSAEGHSLWQVFGIIGSDDVDGTGGTIFLDRD